MKEKTKGNPYCGQNKSSWERFQTDVYSRNLWSTGKIESMENIDLSEALLVRRLMHNRNTVKVK